MTSVTLTVNGRQVTEDVPPRLHLADFLRERLLLTGTHLGCEHGVCGACTIVMDGEPARSCIAYAAACSGMHIRTIEGLEHDPVTTRLRAAFTAHHALQCGYCTPGMLVTARDIVTRLPGACDDTIRLELAGNLCRCTGYNNIVKAIRQVLDENLDIRPLLPLPEGEGRGEGAPSAPNLTSDSTKPAEPPLASPGAGLSKSLSFATTPATLWAALRDPALIAACIPGATLLSQDDGHIAGEMTVSLGPVKARFKGHAAIHYGDATQTGAIEGSGQDQLSATRLTARAAFRVEPGEDGAALHIDIDFSLQGPLAQLAKGRVIDLVADDIAALFARNVSARLAGEAASPPSSLSGFALIWRLLRSWFRTRRG